MNIKETTVGYIVVGALALLLGYSLIHRLFTTEYLKAPPAAEQKELATVPDNPNFKQGGNYKTMQIAARDGNNAVLEETLQNGANPNEAGRHYETVMHWAVGYSNGDAAEILKKYGGNVNAVDNQGRTPLFWAVTSGNPTIVKILLEMGADPNHRDLGERTALQHAIFRENQEMVEILRPVTKDKDPEQKRKIND